MREGGRGVRERGSEGGRGGGREGREGGRKKEGEVKPGNPLDSCPQILSDALLFIVQERPLTSSEL